MFLPHLELALAHKTRRTTFNDAFQEFHPTQRTSQMLGVGGPPARKTFDVPRTTDQCVTIEQHASTP
jgi:hypothetical protein